jgi:hypothetical protein
MSWRTLILTAALSITAACVHAATARAIELRSTDQMPDMIDQNTGTVAISNIGNATLSISYLDGDWKTVQIPAFRFHSTMAWRRNRSSSTAARCMRFTGMPSSIGGPSALTTRSQDVRAASAHASRRHERNEAIFSLVL